MERIKKFKGIRFNPDKVEIKNAVAPPYDVFDYGDPIYTDLKNNPDNIVNIQKPEGPADKKYEEAYNCYKNFIDNKILIQDDSEGIYVLQQKWGNKSRTGIIAAVRIDDSYSKIRPHEKTKPGPIEDRLKLTKATNLHIGSIFLAFYDDKNILMNSINRHIADKDPVYDFTFPDNIENKMFFLKEFDIDELLSDKTLYIADGHHRYRTMIDYRNFMRAENGLTDNNSNYEFAMMFIVPHSELTILSYNRLLKNLDPLLLKDLMKSLEKEFFISESGKEFPRNGSIAFYYDGAYKTLTPKHNGPELLEVEILHSEILERQLGLDEATIKKSDIISYIPSDRELNDIFKLVDSGKYQAAFILPPIKLETIMEFSDNSKIMPRKSTFFYPKVPSGIVLYSSK